MESGIFKEGKQTVCFEYNTIILYIEPSPAVDICFRNLNHKSTQSEACLQKHGQDKEKRPYIIPNRPKLAETQVFNHFHSLYPKSVVFSVFRVLSL